MDKSMGWAFCIDVLAFEPVVTTVALLLAVSFRKFGQ